MRNYLDNTYAALNGVILSYKGDTGVLHIPDSLADMPIDGIGSGAFMESAYLQQIFIPHGVKRIGRSAFSNCASLKTVFITGTVDTIEEGAFSLCSNLRDINFRYFQVSGDIYASIKAGSVEFGDGIFLSCTFPDIKCATDAVSAAGSIRAVTVNPEIKMLFTASQISQEKGRAAISRDLRCLDTRKGVSHEIEENAFVELLSSDSDVSLDRKSEEANDSYLRTDKVPAIEKTAIFVFDDKKTKQANGKFYLDVDIMIGYHFWQSKLPVIYNDKKYFIYRRHYLSPADTTNYYREDAAVFDENGPIMSREKAKAIYAKYRLLTLL